MSVTALPATAVVRVEDDRVVFDEFIETDRHVVDAISAAPDVEVCAHELLHLGAHLAGLAASSGGLAELEARVGARLDALAGTAQTTVTAGLATLAEQSRALLAAEDGEVSTALRTWRADLDAHLGQLFDPDRKRSVITAIEASLRGLLDTYSRRLTSAVDPDVAGSPAVRRWCDGSSRPIRSSPARPSTAHSPTTKGRGRCLRSASTRSIATVVTSRTEPSTALMAG